MEMIIGFSLGVGIVGIVMLGVVTFRLNRQTQLIEKELTTLQHSVSEIYNSVSDETSVLDRRVEDSNRELHRRIDDTERELQSQLDSRLDKLESKLVSKTVLKG